MNRKNGFTLIEMLITIVLLTVILALGVPSFMEFIKNNRVTSQANSLVLAIQVARGEAVKRRIYTILCSANSDYSGCASSNNWTTGWILYIDQDEVVNLTDPETCATEADFDTKNCILRVGEALNKSTLNADNNFLRFLPDGLTSNGPVIFNLEAQDCYKQQKRNITVTLQGRTLSTKAVCT